MGFRDAVQQRTQAAARSAPGASRHAKRPGGRYAGIRSAGARHDRLKIGTYRLELLETRETSRNHNWFHTDIRVLENGGTPGETKIGAIATIMISIGGKSDDVGLPRIKSLIMAAMGCRTDEELDEIEPDWDVLMDAVMSDADAQEWAKPGEDSPAFGVNPLGANNGESGMTVVCSMLDSGTDSGDGTNFANPFFSVDD